MTVMSTRLCLIKSADDFILLLGHQTICTIMSARLKNLSVVGQMWRDGEIKVCFPLGIKTEEKGSSLQYFL